MKHQYIERNSNSVRDERLFGDGMVRLLYSGRFEDTHFVMKALSGVRMTRLLALLNFDSTLTTRFTGSRRFMEGLGVNCEECLESVRTLNTARKIFERKIRYWECRPMAPDAEHVTAPADSRLLFGSFRETSLVYVKEKFFDVGELVGADNPLWVDAFNAGDFAVFRLTPDKYHYTHTPVAGRVLDVYELPGGYHSCNPGAVLSSVRPFSKNRRLVTVLDTDVAAGTCVGLVAMVEIVALMVGGIQQCYSPTRYDMPRTVRPGMFLQKGCPRSLFRPGSSTVVVLFQPGRMEFCEDLRSNRRAAHVSSRFSLGLGEPLVETEVRVRSTIGRAIRMGDKREQ